MKIAATTFLGLSLEEEPSKNAKGSRSKDAGKTDRVVQTGEKPLKNTMSLAAKTPVRLIEAQDLRLHVIKRDTHTARIHCVK